MTYQFEIVNTSTMPDRFKQTLIEAMNYIKSNEPAGLQQILLFGSLARSNITCRSDIDLCLVFDDKIYIDSYEMRVFRGMFCGQEYPVSIDVVMLYESQLKSNSCRLYQEINRDKIILGTN